MTFSSLHFILILELVIIEGYFTKDSQLNKVHERIEAGLKDLQVGSVGN